MSPPEQVDHWSAERDFSALKRAHQLYERRPIEGLVHLKELANAGSPMSMVYIAHAYQVGNGTDKDVAEAERWYRRAAEAGSVCALHALGRLYLIQKRHDEAFRSFRFAAAAGFSPAMFQLGRMYFFGKGVEKDVARAKVYFEDAAALGNVFGKRYLGHLLIRTHLNATELLRGVLLTIRVFIDVFVVLCREGWSSDKLSE
jgi:TPR repeat protein